MTGCPNGCVRPYQSDIGIVGRSGDKYTLFVGGHVLGDRLNFPLRDLVPRAEIVPTLAPVLERFKEERQPGETFGDFCHRQGAEKLQALLPADDHGDHKPESRPELPATNGEAQHKPVAVPAAPRELPPIVPTPRLSVETFHAGPGARNCAITPIDTTATAACVRRSCSTMAANCVPPCTARAMRCGGRRSTGAVSIRTACTRLAS